MEGEVGVSGHDQAVVGPGSAADLGVIPARGAGDEVVDRFELGRADRRWPGRVGPVEDGRNGGQSARAAGEADVGGRPPTIEGMFTLYDCEAEAHVSDVRDRDVQGRAVIVHRDVHHVAAADVHAGPRQVDGRHERIRTIREEARRIGPFSGVVKVVELDGDAVADPAVAEVAATERPGRWDCSPGS